MKPNNRVLSTAKVWVTGLRGEQSTFRQGNKNIEALSLPLEDGGRHDILKIAPIFSWTRADVLNYLEETKAPIHPLLVDQESDWFYESLGCVICSTKQARWEPPRSGRWRWFNQDADDKKECGIHLPQS